MRTRCALLAMAMILLAAPGARAQSVGLGGYGAASSMAGPSLGRSGAMVIPYGGMTEGFMPSRMGGGSSLSFRPRAMGTMGGPRSSSIFADFSGGMSRSDRSARTSMPGPMSPRGLGPSAGRLIRSNPLGGGGGMGVMPPTIGYPFRQPPSLIGPSSGPAGMSM